MSSPTNGFSTVIEDEESLKLFLRKMKDFDEAFCREMFKGSDYTIRLEVRGNKGEVIHVRTSVDAIDRPNGAQQRIDDKASNGISSVEAGNKALQPGKRNGYITPQ